MLQRLEVETHDLGTVRDQRSLVKNALLEAAGMADVVISTGGASAGDTGFIKDCLEQDAGFDVTGPIRPGVVSFRSSPAHLVGCRAGSRRVQPRLAARRAARAIFLRLTAARRAARRAAACFLT